MIKNFFSFMFFALVVAPGQFISLVNDLTE
jgi:hypothetical protein